MRYLVAGMQPWTIDALEAAGRPYEMWDYATTLPSLLAGLCFRPRYVFVLHWSAYLPAEVYARVETINLHATRLPYGRGGNPLENLILRGHTETVITAHRMTADLDAGPIYGVSDPVSLAGTKAEILARFAAPCAALMRTIIDKAPTPTPQVGDVVRFARLSPEVYQDVWATRGR